MTAAESICGSTWESGNQRAEHGHWLIGRNVSSGCRVGARRRVAADRRLGTESRILKAPLSAKAGGWGLFPKQGWRDAEDQDYPRMRQLVEASIAPQRRQDVAGTCGRDDHCACDSCWVRLKNRQDEKKAISGIPLPRNAIPR